MFVCWRYFETMQIHNMWCLKLGLQSSLPFYWWRKELGFDSCHVVTLLHKRYTHVSQMPPKIIQPSPLTPRYSPNIIRQCIWSFSVFDSTAYTSSSSPYSSLSCVMIPSHYARIIIVLVSFKTFSGCGISSNSLLIYLFRFVYMCVCRK